MAINREVARVERELYEWVTERLDAQSEAIIRAWVEAWEEVEAEVEAALLDLLAAAGTGRVTRTQIIRSHRLQAALGHMAGALERAVGHSTRILTEQLMADIRRVADAQAAKLAAQLPAQIAAAASLPVSVSVTGASADQIAAIVRRVTEQITKVTYPISEEAYTAIRRELLRGITVGSNPRTVALRAVEAVEGPSRARRIVRRAMQAVEEQFHGGLSRALTIARTEMLDAHRAAGQAVEERNPDLVAEWVWEAHLGPHNCRACLAMHGQRFPTSTPGPQGHPGCRCARVTVAKTWAELGFTGIRERPSLHRSSEAYFNRLSEANQRKILGDTGFEAWKRGDYPMSEWVKRQDNPGWRPSYIATRPPATIS